MAKWVAEVNEPDRMAEMVGRAFSTALAGRQGPVVVALPHAPNWPNQAAYEIAFGNTWRITLASMFAYFCGERVICFVLALAIDAPAEL